MNCTEHSHSCLLRAVERGADHLLEIILKTASPEFDVNVRTGRRKRGLTSLHLAAADSSGGHLACLDLLLKVREVEVDLKDVSWTATSLYTAGKNRNREGVVKLLQAGADPDLAVGQTGKTVGQFLATWLPELEVGK